MSMQQGQLMQLTSFDDASPHQLLFSARLHSSFLYLLRLNHDQHLDKLDQGFSVSKVKFTLKEDLKP